MQHYVRFVIVSSKTTSKNSTELQSNANSAAEHVMHFRYQRRLLRRWSRSPLELFTIVYLRRDFLPGFRRIVRVAKSVLHELELMTPLPTRGTHFTITEVQLVYCLPTVEQTYH